MNRMRRLSASEASSLIKRSIITIMCVTILIYVIMIVQVAHFAASGTVHLPERDLRNVSITRHQHSTFANGIHWEQAAIDDNTFGISDPFDDENAEGMSFNESPTTNTTSSPDSTEDSLTIESQVAEQMTGIPGEVADTSVDQLRAPDLPSAEADPLTNAATMGKTKPEYVAVPNTISTKTRPDQTATEEGRDTGSREMLPDEDGFISDDMEVDIPQLNPIRSSLAISPENEAMEKRIPDCLIIGVRKGGTRALNKFLNLNPLVRSLGYEVQYFNLMENYAKGEHWYIDQMPLARADQVVVEKSAEYFHVMEVPERVSKLKKDMKLIVVLRDPFQRMVSDYNFIKRYSLQHPDEYDFPEMKHSLENLVVDNTTGKMKFIHGGLHRSEYIKFFRNWLKFFPRNQLLILNGDSFASENPALELQKAEKFLGIKSYITEDMFYKDETKGFYCPKKTGCFAAEKGHRLQQFDAKFEKTVRKYFRYYTKQLNEELGQNFNWD